ncbi:MAG: aminoacetone oxidase family FAD-binding enzyme [Bacillota bacterium]|nr:aminoacetone oxidase family FAD-binding enzyme [Bacillota bacterium]
MVYDCIIIGAGASGLMCAAAMKHPVNGLILEKTKRAGTKLLMSGSGQCNITHAGSIKDFIKCYGENGSKIRSCLYKYNNDALVCFLENGGVKTIVRDDGKIFPASMDAHDILELLLQKSKANGFKIKYESPVTGIKHESGIWQVASGSRTYTAEKLVIACGGCSYPTTGSDGSLFEILSDNLGIMITELKPALSSIHVKDYPYGELSGISFENALVSIWHDGRKEIQNEGPVLFTHHDLSGPGILNISKYASTGDTVRINYLHPLNYEQTLEKLKKSSQGSKADISNIMASELRLPKRFCQILTARCGSSLKNLTRQLTGEEFIISSISGFNKAMATNGGIEISQLKTSTMEFKAFPGLFAIGEAVDIDGITGGYNLQFAFSSACAAAFEQR